MQFPSRHERRPRGHLAFRFLVPFLLLIPIIPTLAADAIGPGVAGQVKALAYDPSFTPSTIYAGGDVCGVYVSYNDGVEWQRWNSGLEYPGTTKSYYVDDLVVLTGGMVDPENSAAEGVYAATHGGIYFRPTNGLSWTLGTDYRTNPVFLYHGAPADDYAANGNCPVPYSCLAFDEVNQILYAGAGNGGRDQSDGTPWKDYYPESHNTNIDQYSLWMCPLADGPGGWTEISATDSCGIVRQIAVVDIDGLQRVVFASRSGVFLLDASRGGVVNLLDPNYADQSLPSGIEWSESAWGIAAGGGDRLYAIFERGLAPDGSTILAPSVQVILLQDSDPTWTLVGDMDQIVPPHDDSITWEYILTGGGAEMYSLTVVPGASIAYDQVYVGAFTTAFGGYYRYGRYEDGSGITEGWVHIIYLEPNDLNVGVDQHFVDWTHGPLRTDDLEVGWLQGAVVQSTVPLIVDPSDTDHMFAMAYHYPISRDPDTGDWTQRNCTETDVGYWDSNGLNLMSAYAADFTESGNLVIGCGDFQCFLANDDQGSGFTSMNP